MSQSAKLKMRCSPELPLPFFPESESELFCQHKLRVTWFEVNFSQTNYGFEPNLCGSNACTIISLLTAAYCIRDNVQFFGPLKELNYFFVNVFARAILDGNYVYCKLKNNGKLRNAYLTLPEAIGHCKRRLQKIEEWKSVLCMDSLGKTLYTNLKDLCDDWIYSSLFKDNKQIFATLICDTRTILFIIDFEGKTVTLVDSHQHTPTKGAMVATTNLEDLKCLCAWLNHSFLRYYRTDAKLYELSMLYFRKHH